MPETRGKIKEMTEDDLEGFDLKNIACRSCSGYGNCGYKTYGILDGKVVSICNQRLDALRRQRDEAGSGSDAGVDAGAASGASEDMGSDAGAGAESSADAGASVESNASADSESDADAGAASGSEEASDAETTAVTDGSNRLNEDANISAPEQQTPQIPSVPSAS